MCVCVSVYVHSFICMYSFILQYYFYFILLDSILSYIIYWSDLSFTETWLINEATYINNKDKDIDRFIVVVEQKS